MPTKFNTANEGQRVDLDPVAPISMPIYENPSGQPQGTGAAIGESVASILGSIGGGNEDRALGAYSVEAADIIGQTSGYASEKERIMQGLSTATDRATMERYLKDLSRLRNGEIQGALRPGAAAARINQLTKDYISRNPTMAKDFRTIHNGLMSDVADVAGSTGKEIDPDIEAMQEVTKAAITKGISTAEEMSFRRAEAVGKAQAETFAAKARMGVATQADIASSVLSNSGKFYTDLMSRMGSAAKNPNFQGMSWFTELSTAKGTIVQSTNMLLQQLQVEGGFTLDREFQRSLVEQVTAPYDQLIQIAEKVDNPKTREAASSALRKIVENGDFMNYRKELGPVVSLLGSESLYAYLGDLSNVAARLEKNGQAELEAIAKYDPKTRMMLDSIYAKGWPQFTADAAKQVDDGVPQLSTGNPSVDRMNLQAQIEYVLNPTNKDLEKGLNYVASDLHAFEAYDKRRDLVAKTKGFDSVINTLKQNSVRQITEAAHQADLQSMRSITFNALDTSTPFSVGRVSQAPSVDYGTARVPGGLYGDKLVYTDSYTADLVNRLNQQYRVFANFLPRAQAQKWAADSLDSLRLVSSGEMDAVVSATPTSEPKQEEVSDPLAAEAAQAGMSLEEYKAWINNPAQ